jgi:hypothetical protein
MKKFDFRKIFKGPMLGWFRFGGSWLGLSVLWSTTTVCPCCGQPVCPFNAMLGGVIGFLGAGFFFVVRNWSRWMSRVRNAYSPKSRVPGKIDEV